MKDLEIIDGCGDNLMSVGIRQELLLHHLDGVGTLQGVCRLSADGTIGFFAGVVSELDLRV